MNKSILMLGLILALIAALILPVAASAATIVNVSNLQPDWTSVGGGGVFSAYIGPPAYGYVSPGTTAVYDGRQAGIIKAGLEVDPGDGNYWDEGLLAFKVPSVSVSTFASQILTYDVVNESGPNPVWVRIRLVSGNQYQFVPTTNPAVWHTVNAAAGMWQLMDSNGNAVGPQMTLTAVAAANPGDFVDRVYLTLGMGNSYNVSPGVGTVGWVDKVTIDSVTYDFVVANPLAPVATVTVSQGGGAIPAVKVKWEQQPVPSFTNTEDGDPTHSVPGFQILPPMVKCAKKMIQYYAVVTDVEDGGSVAQAFADVYHPNGSPEPYGPSVTGGITNAPYFKYEIPFSDLQTNPPTIPAWTKTAAIAKVQQAYNDGLITFGSFTLADVIYELDKGTAHLWMGQAEIDYEQPAGLYDVMVYAVDNNNNLSAVLTNQFRYIPVAGIEADFTGINFGSVNLGVEKMIPGDTIWDSPAGINKATVRNIGNTWASLTVKFDDMGFGKDVNNVWNVNFDARMGSDDTYYVTNIMPNDVITLENALGLSKLEELDLSIKIIKGFGSHSGVITLGSIVRAFTYDPVKVVGESSLCNTTTVTED